MLAELVGRGLQRLSGTANPDQWLIDWVNGGEASSSGEFINEENAMNVVPFKAAVSVLAEAMRVISLDVYRVDKSGRHTAVPDHDVQPLLWWAANPETDANLWMDTTQTHLGIWGNGYSVIQTTIGGKAVAFWQRPPRPERTTLTRNPKDGKLYYELRDEHGQTEDLLPASRMLHFRGVSTDGLVGKSPVKMLKETIGGARAAQRYANELFKNGATPQGYLKHPGKLSEAAYKRLKAQQAERSEHGQRHKIDILEEGIDFMGSSFDPEKMQMTEARLYMLREIACFFRLSPHLLQELTYGTFSNITELGRQFVVYTMTPWCSRWCSELNVKVLKPPYYCKPNFSQFLQADQAARANYHRTMLAAGIECINEARRAEGMNELDAPNANEHFVPLNMVPLSKASDPDWRGSKGSGGADNEPKPGAPTGGDGQTPADPVADEPPQKQTADDQGDERLRKSAEAHVAETLKRMERVEANAVSRFAKEPATFLSNVDAFFGEQAAKLREALSRPVELAILAGSDMSLATIVDDHIAEKQTALLRAAECQPAELAARVTAVYAQTQGV